MKVTSRGCIVEGIESCNLVGDLAGFRDAAGCEIHINAGVVLRLASMIEHEMTKQGRYEQFVESIKSKYAK